MVLTCEYESPLGRITLASENNALTGLWFQGQRYYGNNLPGQYEMGEAPVFDDARRWLDIYFSGGIPEFTPALQYGSTPFRRLVCDVMLSIPYGQTMTYGEIARIVAERCGRPKMSAQAVGGAVGHNPISLIIPCHRVVGTNGSLTGYAGGMEKKISLLKLEKADMSRLFVPKNVSLPDKAAEAHTGK